MSLGAQKLLSVSASSHEDGLCNAVYEKLKGEILSGRFRPGLKLTHQGIADKMSVSRTPVREALERLHQEGYVVREPRRGFFVGEIGNDDARDLYGVREALELFNLSCLKTTGFNSGLAHLRSINRRYERLIRRDLTYERLMVDREFHVGLARIGGNKCLADTLDGIFERLILKRHLERLSDTRGDQPYREHVALLDALADGRTEEAANLLRVHIRSASERLLAHMRSFAGATIE